VVDAMLDEGIPIHFGGMADPFGRAQETQAVTRELLGALADYRQATVISTKGLTRNTEHYETLRRGRFVVQFSFSTLDSRLAQQIEVGLPPPHERLEAMADLAALGIPVTARLQPLLPGLATDARDLIDAFAGHGARHVGVEHLKLPLEQGFNGTDQLSRRLGRDLRAEYVSLGAKRVGREYVLPASERLSTILDLRDYVHRRGMRFGAADTDLLLLSDGSCCCSGTDLLGLEMYHRYTYVEAVRLSPPDRITFGSLSSVQPPPGTISRFVNSRSRIQGSDRRGADIAAYVRRNWNGRPNGPAPGMLWGVEATGEVDAEGLRVYRLSDEAQNLVAPRALMS
jgi:hypothetical protein